MPASMTVSICEPISTGAPSGIGPARQMPKMLPMRSTTTSSPACRSQPTKRSRPALSVSEAASRDQPALAGRGRRRRVHGCGRAGAPRRSRSDAHAGLLAGQHIGRAHADQFGVAMRVGRALGVEDQHAGFAVEPQRVADLRGRPSPGSARQGRRRRFRPPRSGGSPAAGRASRSHHRRRRPPRPPS